MPTRLALALVTFSIIGCAPANPDVGRHCDEADPCPADMFCVENYDGDQVCMEACPEASATCLDGSFCIDTTFGNRVCWPGGPIAEGGTCESHGDCAHGTQCIHYLGEPAPVCERACTVGRSNECLAGEQCFSTVGGSGVCMPVT